MGIGMDGAVFVVGNPFSVGPAGYDHAFILDMAIGIETDVLTVFNPMIIVVDAIPGAIGVKTHKLAVQFAFLKIGFREFPAIYMVKGPAAGEMRRRNDPDMADIGIQFHGDEGIVGIPKFTMQIPHIIQPEIFGVGSHFSF